jgi:hypothetical protein
VTGEQESDAYAEEAERVVASRIEPVHCSSGKVQAERRAAQEGGAPTEVTVRCFPFDRNSSRGGLDLWTVAEGESQAVDGKRESLERNP